LIVAVAIFAIGGGVSAFEGGSRRLHPGSIERPVWNYGVSLVALLADSYYRRIFDGTFGKDLG
jgi:hypothetical protein